eukprot:gene11294-15152_t
MLTTQFRNAKSVRMPAPSKRLSKVNHEDPNSNANKHLSIASMASLANGLTSYFNDRESIQLELTPESEEEALEENAHAWVGNSINETYNLNSRWIQKLFRFFLFYLIGWLFYSNVEGWDFLTCIYFSTQTASTLGYGNISPKTPSGRIFTPFFILFGMLIVFTVVNDVVQRFIIKSVKKTSKRPVRRKKLQIIVRKSINAVLWLILLFSVVLFGSLVFCLNENLTFVDGFYFSFVTATSVGYGDISIVKQSSIIFNQFFILISISMTAIALDKLASLRRHIDQAEVVQLMDKIELTPGLIKAIDPKPGDINRKRITTSDYILHMLLLSNVIDRRKHVTPWLQRFKDFDFDGDGYLTMEDVRAQLEMSKIEQRATDELSTTSRPSEKKRKSVFMEIADEVKDVFLESVNLKDSDEEGININFDDVYRMSITSFTPFASYSNNNPNGKSGSIFKRGSSENILNRRNTQNGNNQNNNNNNNPHHSTTFSLFNIFHNVDADKSELPSDNAQPNNDIEMQSNPQKNDNNNKNNNMSNVNYNHRMNSGLPRTMSPSRAYSSDAALKPHNNNNNSSSPLRNNNNYIKSTINDDNPNQSNNNDNNDDQNNNTKKKSLESSFVGKGVLHKGSSPIRARMESGHISPTRETTKSSLDDDNERNSTRRGSVQFYGENPSRSPRKSQSDENV